MTEELLPPSPPKKKDSDKKPETSHRGLVLGAIVFVVVILGGIAATVIGLLNPNTPTERIRDIFIIFMAFEALVVGAALVI